MNFFLFFSFFVVRFRSYFFFLSEEFLVQPDYYWGPFINFHIFLRLLMKFMMRPESFKLLLKEEDEFELFLQMKIVIDDKNIEKIVKKILLFLLLHQFFFSVVVAAVVAIGLVVLAVFFIVCLL